MPKQKADIINSTFEGNIVDWEVIIGSSLHEGLHAFQASKKLCLMIQQFFAVLLTPQALLGPSPTLGQQKRRLEVLGMTNWEEEGSTRAPKTAIPRNEQWTPPEEETDKQASSPKPKRRRLDRKDGRGLVIDATPQPTPAVTVETEPTHVFEKIPRNQSTLTGNTERGKGILTPDNVI